MEKDIVCGKTVPDTTLYRTDYGDRPYFFCSKNCEMDFAGNPLKFVDKSRSATTISGSPVITESGQEKAAP